MERITWTTDFDKERREFLIVGRDVGTNQSYSAKIPERVYRNPEDRAKVFEKIESVLCQIPSHQQQYWTGREDKLKLEARVKALEYEVEQLKTGFQDTIKTIVETYEERINNAGTDSTTKRGDSSDEIPF